MTNLPINTAIAPAQLPGKAAPAEDAPQTTNGFGEVLARQVADSPTAADKNTDASPSGDAPAANAPDRPAELISALPNALPTDMLAALLAQQNPVNTTQTAGSLQQAVNTQIPPGAPSTALSSVSGADMLAPRAALIQPADPLQAGTESRALAGTDSLVSRSIAPETGTIPQDALKAGRGARQMVPGIVRDNTTSLDALQLQGKRDMQPALGGEVARHLGMEEFAPAPQPGESTPTLSAMGIRDTAQAGTQSTAATSLNISTPLVQSGWDHEFSQKITWLATQRDQSAELHLNPPQLGPLDVVIKVSADQATAMFTSPHAAVREAIEQALPKLREMLADNGIMLGNATVSDQASRRNQDDFARAQQGSGQGSAHTGEVTPALAQGERNGNLPRHNGMVDTFA